jgi:hypothetical protein
MQNLLTSFTTICQPVISYDPFDERFSDFCILKVLVHCAQYSAIIFSIHLHSNARDVAGFHFYQENFLIV